MIWPPFWPKMAENGQKSCFFFIFSFFSFFFCSIIVLFQLISFMMMRNHVKNTINFKCWWFDLPKGSKRAKKLAKYVKIKVFHTSIKVDLLVSLKMISIMFYVISCSVRWRKRARSSWKFSKNCQKIGKIFENQDFWDFDQNWLISLGWKWL